MPDSTVWSSKLRERVVDQFAYTCRGNPLWLPFSGAGLRACLTRTGAGPLLPLIQRDSDVIELPATAN